MGAIVAEATKLREFFAQQVPALGCELSPLTLEPEAPERVRGFWETFGWTDALARRWSLQRPEASAGRQIVRELLQEMREDEVELQSELPKRHRLVEVDPSGAGFSVTDEDGGAADPRVLGVVSDTGEVAEIHPSYLNFCANELVRASFSGWNTLPMTLSSYELVTAAEAPWSLLSPATRRLAPDLWLVPNHADVVAPGPHCHLAYGRLEAVTRWLMALPEGQTLSLPVLPDEALRIANLAEIEALLDSGARSFSGSDPDERVVVGTLEGRPVLARQLGALCEVATEPSQTAWLRDKLGKGRSEPAHGGPSPARAPSNGTDRDPIRDEELVELDALLSELCPQHRTTKKGVELEPDAPERMRRVWEALGDSQATAEVRLSSREESRAALERVFEEWFAEPRSRSVWATEGGAEGYFRALPARYRLLLASTDEIVITDETGATGDPPVLVMRKTQPPILVECRSCVNWWIWKLLATVTRSRNATYNVHSGIRGERLLRSLYPQIERLGDGVYWMKMPERLRTDFVPSRTARIFYRTLGDYFQWVLGLPDEQIRFTSAPEAMTFTVSPPGVWDVWKKAPEGFRRFQPVGTDGKVSEIRREGVGRIEDVYLWLSRVDGDRNLFVSFDPRKEKEVRAIVDAHKLKIKTVRRMPKDYDAYGW